jgi:two-component system, NarL family, sensor histidine kinase UhpB
MDLRRRLVARLGILLCALLCATLVAFAISLHTDADAEMRSSQQLAAVVAAAVDLGRHPDDRAARDLLEARIAADGLRHVRIVLDGAAPAPVDESSFAALLGRWSGLAAGPAHTIALERGSLRVEADPQAEIAEKIGDLQRLGVALLFFSGATLLIAWTAAHRALAPVRELEHGLQRLADGAPDAALPNFALREFARIGAAIDALAGALERSRSAQRQLARQLISVQEAERQELARELHDEMGQSLTAINVGATYLERHADDAARSRIAECAADIHQESRRLGSQLKSLLQRLRPHDLEQLGVAAALAELVAGWRRRVTDLRIDFESPPTLPACHGETALTLYRAAQEALTNVMRHSGANHCQVSLRCHQGGIELTVADNGCGCPQLQPGNGLLGMRERLAMIGGHLELENGNRRGLCLCVRVPRLPLSQQEVMAA